MIQSNNRTTAAAATSSTPGNTTSTATPQPPVVVVPLRLRARSTVRWDENVVDNEGAGRKSSKRCCIFHKQHAFGESSTDSSDNDDGNASQRKKIARKKGTGAGQSANKDPSVPDFMRFHA